MAHFAVSFGQSGAILSSFIGITPSLQAHLLQEKKPIPSVVPVRLLVDTGASITMICEEKIKLLGLSPTGYLPVHTPSTGNRPENKMSYDLNLLMPGRSLQDGLFLPDRMVLASNFVGQPEIDGLLGRDILANCHMTYSGADNICLLSFSGEYQPTIISPPNLQATMSANSPLDPPISASDSQPES